MYKKKYKCPNCGKVEISTEEMLKTGMGFYLCEKCNCLWSVADNGKYYFELKKRKKE